MIAGRAKGATFKTKVATDRAKGVAEGAKGAAGEKKGAAEGGKGVAGGTKGVTDGAILPTLEQRKLSLKRWKGQFLSFVVLLRGKGLLYVRYFI